MKLIRKIWNAVDGHKTTIGSVSTSVLLILKGTVGMNPDLFLGLVSLTSVIFGVGGVHKGLKTETGKKLINKFKK